MDKNYTDDGDTINGGTGYDRVWFRYCRSVDSNNVLISNYGLTFKLFNVEFIAGYANFFDGSQSYIRQSIQFDTGQFDIKTGSGDDVVAGDPTDVNSGAGATTGVYDGGKGYDRLFLHDITNGRTKAKSILISPTDSAISINGSKISYKNIEALQISEDGSGDSAIVYRGRNTTLDVKMDAYSTDITYYGGSGDDTLNVASLAQMKRLAADGGGGDNSIGLFLYYEGRKDIIASSNGGSIFVDFEENNHYTLKRFQKITIGFDFDYGGTADFAKMNKSGTFIFGSNAVISAGSGNDTFKTFARNMDALGSDKSQFSQIDGGGGVNRIDFTDLGFLSNVILNLSDGNIQQTYGAGYIKVANIQNVTGGDAGDLLQGSAARNEISGGPGNDDIDGGAGNDILCGDIGNDKLLGGAGNDRLAGGAGHDTLNGGIGRDVFIFDILESSSESDTILDFASGKDRIEISVSAFPSLADLGVGSLTNGELALGSMAMNSAQHLVYNQANGGLYYDTDGVGGVAQILIVTLASKPALGAGDIWLV